jgi:serine/threonine protein phosphatase PrpC
VPSTISDLAGLGVQVPCENFSIEYAYVSQRGYYPEAPNKSNQDTYCVQTEFMGNPNRHLFGVFDGHGTQGTACSIFARDNVRVWAFRRLPSLPWQPAS